MKKLTILNTVLLLIVIGWLTILSLPESNEPEAPTESAEYVYVEYRNGFYYITDTVLEGEIVETLGVYVVYQGGEYGYTFLGNLTLYEIRYLPEPNDTAKVVKRP